MKAPKRYNFYKKVLISTGLIMLAENILPTISWALTSGPSQPEFSSFEPVATTNMVNDFTGDFTYNLPVLNIPGANGGGYSLSLSYHSGASPEEEASWVGYGWTLNPGAISRNKRGFPDDYKGQTVKYWNKVPANQTVSVGMGASIEAFSIGVPLNLNASLRYNNYKGFGYSAGAGVNLANGLVSLGYSISDGDGSFSVRINPGALISVRHHEEKKSDNDGAKKASKALTQQELRMVQKKEEYKRQREQRLRNPLSHSSLTLAGSNYGIFTFSDQVRNESLTEYTGASFNLDVSVMGTLTPLQVGPTFDLNGSYSYQQNKNDVNPLPVYGYMYSSSAPSNGNTMMDYYMEKMNAYDKQDKYLGIPFNNADIYSVTGEGVGGGFRMYNKKAGHFHPNAVSSSIGIYNLGGEIEAGLNIGGGFDLGVGFQSLSSNNWADTLVTDRSFADSSSYDEANFFRFNNDLGGSLEYGSNDDNPESADLKMVNAGVPGFKKFAPVLSTSKFSFYTNSGERSGRSSYISYHTNRQMTWTENGKKYKSYNLNSYTNGLVTRTGTAILDQVGEIATFNEDGSRYVYGLPVYSRNEGNMQYDLQGLSSSAINHNYLAYRNINSNIKSKVGEERDAPYATSYLLTEITSSDYVDRTMDGPTDDDFGGFTRFSYKRIYGTNDKSSATSWYRWRIPYTGLLMN